MNSHQQHPSGILPPRPATAAPQMSTAPLIVAYNQQHQQQSNPHLHQLQQLANSSIQPRPISPITTNTGTTTPNSNTNPHQGQQQQQQHTNNNAQYYPHPHHPQYHQIMSHIQHQQQQQHQMAHLGCYQPPSSLMNDQQRAHYQIHHPHHPSVPPPQPPPPHIYNPHQTSYPIMPNYYQQSAGFIHHNPGIQQVNQTSRSASSSPLTYPHPHHPPHPPHPHTPQPPSQPQGILFLY